MVWKHTWGLRYSVGGGDVHTLAFDPCHHKEELYLGRIMLVVISGLETHMGLKVFSRRGQ